MLRRLVGVALVIATAASKSMQAAPPLETKGRLTNRPPSMRSVDEAESPIESTPLAEQPPTQGPLFDDPLEQRPELPLAGNSRHDAWARWDEGPLCDCPACNGGCQGAWPRPAIGDITVGSRFGPLHVGEYAPACLSARAGFVGTAGTHTLGLGHERGVAGILFPLDRWRFDYDIANVISAFDEQWSYDFPGIQNQFSIEALTGYRCPLSGGHRPSSLDLMVGMRLDWYFNRSFRQLADDERTVEDDHSLLSQRLGTYYIQCDWTEGWRLDRLRLSFTNDTAGTGGDGGDHFRTAQARIRYLRHRGPWQARLGLGMDLFTGSVDQQRTTPDGRFYITQGLPFSDRSQGLLELELGMSHFRRVGPTVTEVGFNVSLGPDTESIRDFFQNNLIHRNLLHVPEVPLVDRDDRFKFDLSLFLVVHFG